MDADNFEIGGVSVAKGERRTIDLEVANLFTHALVTMPVHVVRGKHDGPTLFISAAIHGDELNGIEIVRRLLTLPTLKHLRGTLIAVPIVNVQGFLAQTRYLPDRRDLNRCFPGSERGSMGGRLAHLFAKEVLMKSDCGIDLHTGAIHRSNLPQIRANLDDPRVQKLADAFGTPLMLNSDLREGSLREYASSHDVPILVFEAGEALRFDETCISTGLKGVVNVMRSLGMLRGKAGKSKKPPILARSSSWMRAEQSGIFRATAALGDRVSKGDTLGYISDPLGDDETQCKVPFDGVIIGRLNLPLVNEGDAIFHVAKFGDAIAVEELVGEMHQHIDTLSDAAPIL